MVYDGCTSSSNTGFSTVSLWLMFLWLALPLSAQHTFSILAYDNETGSIGSAGASCIENADIISVVLPGKGAAHVQAYFLPDNKLYAIDLIDKGFPADVVLDSLLHHDAGGNPAFRQYAVLTVNDSIRTQAYTGKLCHYYAGHRLGSHYILAGNTLLAPFILDMMEEAYLQAGGTMADKLLTALQAVTLPGADNRCLPMGKSALSAFLKIYLPTDEPCCPAIDLKVRNTPPATDPIDSLTRLYHAY